MTLLSVSLVAFRSAPEVLLATLHSLARSTAQLIVETPGTEVVLYLIDNAPEEGLEAVVGSEPEWKLAFREVIVFSGHGNIGYGAGHNLAIARTESRFHLVVNPDVQLSANALAVAIEILNARTDIGLIAPRTVDAEGKLQCLIRRRPTVFDLLLRGFAPTFIQRLFTRRLNRYTMYDEVQMDVEVVDPPIISGCFMFFRTEVLRSANGFDPRYFLYFEDYDLSLRVAQFGRTLYAPAVRIVHYGGGASRKGIAHIKMFSRSALLFFRIHGWRWV